MMNALFGFTIALMLLTIQSANAQPSILRANTTGEQIYKSVCFACHESGVASAPKFGDREAWGPLIKEGQSMLTGHAWIGVRAMPARGGSTEISLNEFSRAVAYMARAAGADWKDPDSKVLYSIIREADKRLAEAIRNQKAMQRELHALAKNQK
jgi:cytochrome c5